MSVARSTNHEVVAFAGVVVAAKVIVCEAHNTFGDVIVAVGKPPTVTLSVAGLMQVPSTLIVNVPADTGVKTPVLALIQVEHSVHDQVSVEETLGETVNAIG
jgi:hypothetical protein